MRRLRTRRRAALASALDYAGNWYFIAAPLDPNDTLGRPPLYEHPWSLAVEEQFSLLWPMVLPLAPTVPAVR